MRFGHLRKEPWNPTFEWVESVARCADMINLPHEDYPKRVGRTETAIKAIKPSAEVSNRLLLSVHRRIF